MSAWLSIETAPKDGTEILLGYTHSDPYAIVGKYFNTDYLSFGVVTAHYEGWRVPGISIGPTVDPTHWMPLPPLPKAPA